jgi:hypothetical protein
MPLIKAPCPEEPPLIVNTCNAEAPEATVNVPEDVNKW